MRRGLAVWTAVLCACSVQASPTTELTSPATHPPTSAPITTAVATTVAPTATAVVTTTAAPEPGTVRPDWLGTRVLPERPDGLGVAQPTPPEMLNRRYPSPDLLPPPAGAEFEFTLGPVPAEVATRSSWQESCPVTLEELSYATVSFIGFDGASHTGELLVNADHAEGIVQVMRLLYETRFPIEEMRVITAAEIEAPPTGDWNSTTSFVCRPAVGRDSGWSMHAFGLAVDINPFHNPYLRGEVVVPELASAYTDRAALRPGMIVSESPVVTGFAEIGWEWGGNWQSAKDWMHFSENGR
ncbi:MAG TPA: M15 family metallopeptidase [Acidimicrobiia bacterium]|nr:M15 family metallopeptidase [Acidimicrobiia bacterium]